MMSGYTHVFGSIYDGTLYGRWPMAVVWVSLLPLADRYGRVNLSLEAIAGRTGWPLELLKLGIAQLCEPDPESSSRAQEGRRLVPLNPSRNWGWQIVNHSLYREKARKAAHDASRVESGANAARMAKRQTRAHPTRPDGTLADPLSNTYATPFEEPEPRVPLLSELPDAIDQQSWSEWLAYRRERRLPMSSRALALDIKALLPYAPEHQRTMVERSIQAGWKGLFPLKGDGRAHRSVIC
jgi:hypothetical protein